MSIWDLAMHIHCETCEERLHPIADESWSNRIVRIVVNRKPGPRWTSKEQMGANEYKWMFGTFFIFPYIGNSNPNWLIFFRGVETTNQWMFIPSSGNSRYHHSGESRCPFEVLNFCVLDQVRACRGRQAGSNPPEVQDSHFRNGKLHWNQISSWFETWETSQWCFLWMSTYMREDRKNGYLCCLVLFTVASRFCFGWLPVLEF